VVLLFFNFQNQRIVGCGFLRKNQNQGIADLGTSETSKNWHSSWRNQQWAGG